MTQAPAIEFSGVHFAYGQVPVLEDATFTVSAGELACVVGPNGGGKTTLLRLILGLLRPTAGQVRVLGIAPERARVRIGYMPQHVAFDPQFPVTAMDVVLMGRLGRRWGGPYRRADRVAARAALSEAGLEGLESAAFSQLSGGQRQRVLIARALACEPDLLLLDEPTANIDAAAELRLTQMLQSLGRLTVLMVTHDLGFVSEAVHQVICVNRRVFKHPTQEISGDKIRDLYGGQVRLVRHDHFAAAETGQDEP